MKNKKGFTLIELMVAMGIIAILVTLTITGIQIVLQSTRNTQRVKVLDEVELAITSYWTNNGTYPTSVSFGGSSVTIDGQVVLTLSGPTTAAGSTTPETTQYCYSSTGATYSIGVELEGGGQRHKTTSSSNCGL